MSSKNNIIQNDTYDSNYVYVYIFSLNRTGLNFSLVFIKVNAEESFEPTFSLDGYYTLCRIVVPKDESAPYYYRNGRFYKGPIEVELLELLEVNPSVSGLDIKYYNFFLVDNLRQCYVNYAKTVLDARTSTAKCSPVDLASIYRRDLVWSALNVINYFVEDGQFEEAERILEKIVGCNGLCQNINYSCGCGG